MMFSNWFQPKIKKIGFEDMKRAIDSKQYIIINTMENTEQDCLILNTIEIHQEEPIINQILEKFEMKIQKIIIYGKNACDDRIDKKYTQLNGLGFSNIYIYCGGMFEWLLLQDIYGEKEFPTTRKVLDILKYKPDRIIL
jgi:hypothetical protein